MHSVNGFLEVGADAGLITNILKTKPNKWQLGKGNLYEDTRGILAAILTIAIGLAACEKKQEPAPAADAAKNQAAETAAKEKEALDTAVEAYVYAYPLVTMEYTRRVMTNVAGPEGSNAPMGQFAAAAAISGRLLQGRDGAERRYALHARLARRVARSPGSSASPT